MTLENLKINKIQLWQPTQFPDLNITENLWWWFYLYGSQLAGLVYIQYIHSNKHTKSQNRNYKEKKKIKIIKKIKNKKGAVSANWGI